MILEVILLIAGLVLLVKGGDLFVESAAGIAKRFGVSDFIIGLTIVAIGTSIPEAAAAILAAYRGAAGLVVGNIMGSNIANIGFIIGISSMLVAVKASKDVVRLDGFVLIFVSFMAFAFFLDGQVSGLEGLLLLLTYAAYVLFLLEITRNPKTKKEFRAFFNFIINFDYIITLRSLAKGLPKKQKQSVRREFVLRNFGILLFSGVAVWVGANLVIDNALKIALMISVSESIIGFTVIALGTSLPELGVSLAALRKGLPDMMLGNIIGSNVANLAFVGGVSAIIRPLLFPSFTTLLMGIPMILFTLLLFIFIYSGKQLRKQEGLLLLILYLVTVVFIVGYGKG